MMSLEESLKQINAKYVKLHANEIKKNNEMLTKFLSLILAEMKKDVLFKALCSRNPFYGGSYYDGLKVSKPDEYDIDILLDLPKVSKPVVKTSSSAGYVEVSISMVEIDRNEDLTNFNTLKKKLLDDENYISKQKVNSWFEGLVQKALNNLASDINVWIVTNMKKSGPAKTIRVMNGDNYFDIDLVPCFFFTQAHWPVGYESNNSSEGFFIVPKPVANGLTADRKWRASFQCQEKLIINDIGRIKPALRLIKVLRDKQNFALKSYFIKTIFLLEVDGEQSTYRYKTLSDTFMEMLEKVQSYTRNGKIPFYWDHALNLLDDWSDIHRNNVADRLNNIIRDIKRNPNNAWKYFGSSETVSAQGSNEDFTFLPAAGSVLPSIDNCNYVPRYVPNVSAKATESQESQSTKWGWIAAGVTGLSLAVGAILLSTKKKT